jgi:CIC family chloride channel protein
VYLLAFAVATGVVGGLGAIAFRLMIAYVATAFRWLERPIAHSGDDRLLVALAPAVGLLVVYGITRYFAREVRGHGVPQILEALALRGGRIRPRVGLFGILAPAITIGSGGSVGREGPIALIGGAFGSSVGQLLRLPDRYVTLLLACGSAAGIGATFNAPIAGGFFGLEVILGTYSLGAMVPVFLASVAGVATLSAFEGIRAVLAVPAYVPGTPLAVLAAMVLGLLGAGVGIAYTRGLDGVERVAERVALPGWARALVGGAFVGALGLFLPQILGVGYPTMHQALVGALPLALLALLLVAKYVATLVTIGAGGSGGVFAPSLFLGAMLGGAYGVALHDVFRALAPQPQAYAVAGMATVFAAAAQAPFVAITILLEITGDYRLTVLVMAAAAVAYFAYALVTRDSMYTVRLSRRGIKILRGNDVRPIEAVAVTAALEPLPPALPWDTPVREAHRRLTADAAPALAVAARSPQGRLVGLIGLVDLAEAAADGAWEAPVGRYAAPPPARLGADQSLDDAMRLMALHGATALPVEGEGGELLGVVTIQGVMRAYHSTTLPALAPARTPRAGDPGAFVEVRLGEGSPLVGRRLAETELPNQALVVSIERDGATFAPHGQSVFQVGDRLVLFVSPASQAQAVRRRVERSPNADRP